MKTVVCTLAWAMLWVACKPLVRKEMHEFQPSAITSEDGQPVARQIVLITNDDDNSIEERLKNDPELEEKLNQIMLTRGRQNKVTRVIDGARDFFFSLPGKLLLWNRSFGSADPLHKDAETAVKLALLEGDSLDTHISINEYNPKLIWSRTFKNDKASFLAKITLGTLAAIIYTVIPRRLVAGDAYFPIADTVVLYSDNMDIALHEAGHAIDFAEKHKVGIGPGIYNLGAIVFPIRLYQEAVATGKAFEFTAEHGASEDLRSSYALLFPAFGTYLAASIFSANRFVDKVRVARGKEVTGLTKWLRTKTDDLLMWQAERGLLKLGNYKQIQEAIEIYGVDAHKHIRSFTGKKILKWTKRLVSFMIIIPVVITAHIAGRVMGAKVKTPNDQPINPKFDDD